MSTINSSSLFTRYRQYFISHKNNIGVLPACIVEGNIQMGNSHWFGIIPFFSYSTQNSSLHFRNTFLILLTVGFLTLSVSPTPFQGMAVWLSTDESQATPGYSSRPDKGIYLGWGRLLHLAYSPWFHMHFFF